MISASVKRHEVVERGIARSVCQRQDGDGRLRKWLRTVNRGDKAITTPRRRFDIARCVPAVAECRSEMREAGVQRAFVLDEHAAAPEVAPDFVARDELSGVSREEGQQAGGLRSQPDSPSAFPEFPCPRI